ncbi:peptidase family C78-domain-containing protein [Infundibulicybe gibba]|nr:peptidase family C78-domain-containing protein [Infundibulicybe gibba]
MSYTLHTGNKTRNTITASPTGGTIDGPIQCGFCSQDLSVFPTVAQRESHYENHFAQSSEPKGMEQSNGMTTSTSGPSHKPSRFKGGSMSASQEVDIFWHPTSPGPPPANFNPGFIPLLGEALRKSYDRGDSRLAAVCYENSVHIRREKWDTGWGCGHVFKSLQVPNKQSNHSSRYRNFLMACAALMGQPTQPSYRSLLKEPIEPGVRNLQAWIEAAWADGFDVEGARDLKKLVGTSKWLGASDLWVAFSYRGIPAELVDFDLKQRQDVQVIIDWVVNYFTPGLQADEEAAHSASPVVATDKMPLILQHDGHSRTIVGYEVTKTGLVNLLMFDPSYIPSKRIRQAGLAYFDVTSVKPKTPRLTLPSFFRVRSTSHRGLGNQKRSVGTSLPQPSLKRRQSAATASRGEDDDVILIRGSRDQQYTRAEIPNAQMHDNDGDSLVHGLNPVDILKHFRLDPKKLGRKKKYQILYFPLTPPLTQEVRIRRKVVESEKFC